MPCVRIAFSSAVIDLTVARARASASFQVCVLTGSAEPMAGISAAANKAPEILEVVRRIANPLKTDLGVSPNLTSGAGVGVRPSARFFKSFRLSPDC